MLRQLSNFGFDYEHKKIDRSLIIHADCLEWLGRVPENTIHGIVTDPPYGVKEYQFDQLEKRANGNGGIWRIPPSFDGSTRQPLPRFTALNQKERDQLTRFFTEWARVAVHALRPGGHVFIACNSFLCQMVYDALVREAWSSAGNSFVSFGRLEVVTGPRMRNKSSQTFAPCHAVAMSLGASCASQCLRA